MYSGLCLRDMLAVEYVGSGPWDTIINMAKQTTALRYSVGIVIFIGRAETRGNGVSIFRYAQIKMNSLLNLCSATL